jgi:NAD(P)-dependent dehydrogenase (short-subunit alcohol dehydrogenase family)
MAKGTPMDSSNRPLALVTGASSGLGIELARELARHGHDLVLSARRVAPMEALAAELRGLGAAVTVIAADLAQPGAAAALADDIASRNLEIDVLVNNAGLGALGWIDRIVSADQRDVAGQHRRLTELTRLILPGWSRRRGRILLVSSVAGSSPDRAWRLFRQQGLCVALGSARYSARHRHQRHGTVSSATETEFFRTAGATESIMAKRLRHMMRGADVARIGYAPAAGRRS